MERIDFNKLRTVTQKVSSATTNVKNSKDCYPEYNSLVSNYIIKHNSFKEKESALHIISMQNWIMKKDKQTVPGALNVGEIWYADLGSNYKPEASYNHPVVILELIGNMVLVIPCTTSPRMLSKAFHPIDNPTGNMYLRKVTRTDGFASDCTLILSNIRSISKGRLVDRKGQLNDITNPTSIFYEIKNKCLQFCFPKQHIDFLKAQQQIQDLTVEKQELLDKIKELEEKER